MDVVEYVEKCFNNELREYQKILLHNAVHEKKYYTIPIKRASLIAQSVKNLPAMQDTWV